MFLLLPKVGLPVRTGQGVSTEKSKLSLLGHMWPVCKVTSELAALCTRQG